MLKGHKVAIARIFSDLIKADRIIDVGEMKYWQEICLKYSIGQDVAVESQSITFAEAVDTISSSGVKGLKEDILGDCRAMALSDGFCAHSEASIMIALSLILDAGQNSRIETISIPRADFNIDISTVLYIESDYDKETNASISKYYRTIYKELQLAGFHFVYLPKIIEHYQNTEKTLFRNILSFLAPSLGEIGIEGICNSLMCMTTSRFCKDLLCNKLGLGELRNTYPCLLIKIGNSFVGETQYANYLKIEVDEDILLTVQSFVDKFCEMLSSDVYVVNASEEREDQFHFHGFYKQLLDIFLIRKNIRSTILIDPYKEEIYFPEIDAKATGLHRREKVMYAMMLCYGQLGLNFNAPRDAEGLKKYIKRLATIQSKYRAIYSLFGGDHEIAPDLSMPEIRRPIVSCLKRSLKQLSSLYNPEDYNITKDRSGVLSVHVEPELVFVKEHEGSEPVPLLESKLYHIFVNA